ncbi:MAG: glycosyltransferase family 4 protein [Deltaproteobacteria bacterium]|nr:glycosyltransferase family 4 protein [Deltaproteobacteria bacterium]
MHICFIEDTKLHGGTQIWVTEATRAFIDAGAEVTILTPEAGWVGPRCSAIGATIVQYDYQDVINENAENRKIWAEGLQDADVAICTVHPPRAGFHCSVFASRVIREFGLKTILIPKTGTIVPEYERRFYLPDEAAVSYIIAITDFTRRYLIDTYKIPAGRVELIYQGTEVDLFTRNAARHAEALKRYPIRPGASPLLGYAGSFEKRKGLPILLEAVAGARQQFPDIHLMLVGDGPDEAKLKQMVHEMHLDGNVSFSPFTSEPVYIFELIDIIVLSSLYKEGLPNILLEAMSMELPVISSRLAGVPEIVKNGETGYMVEPGDAAGFSDAIIKLWSDKQTYGAMTAKARRLMEARFDKKQQFKAFIHYFETITDGKGHS